VTGEIVDALERKPWLLRQVRDVVEALARQGYRDHILTLLDFYRSDMRPMAEYMRAVILRAIRYLPVVDTTLEAYLISFATSPSHSLVERLMASETCVFLLGNDPGAAGSELLSAVKSIGEGDEATPIRLLKNYVLLGGATLPIARGAGSNNDDPMLTEALRVAHSSGFGRLLLYPEPQLIRDEYYSGQYPDYIDEADSSF
jgi:hypothetical protein